MGNIREEVLLVIAADHDRMLDSFINNASATIIRRRLEDDISSIPDGLWRITKVPIEAPDVAPTHNETPRAVETRSVLRMILTFILGLR